MTEPRYVWIRDLNRRVYAEGVTNRPTEDGYWRKEALVEADQVKNIRKKLVTTVRGLQFTQEGLPNPKTRDKNPGVDRCVFSEKEKDDYVYVLKTKYKVAEKIERILQREGDVADAADALRHIEQVLQDLEGG